MTSNHLIFYHPLLLLPSIFPSIKVFSNKSVLHIKQSKYWNFSPFNEYSGPISFRIDQFDFLAVQGTLKSLLQNHSSKPSIIWSSAFFMVFYLQWMVDIHLFILSKHTYLLRVVDDIHCHKIAEFLVYGSSSKQVPTPTLRQSSSSSLKF